MMFRRVLLGSVLALMPVVGAMAQEAIEISEAVRLSTEIGAGGIGDLTEKDQAKIYYAWQGATAMENHHRLAREGWTGIGTPNPGDALPMLYERSRKALKDAAVVAYQGCLARKGGGRRCSMLFEASSAGIDDRLEVGSKQSDQNYNRYRQFLKFNEHTLKWSVE